jgi:hypothetical protein
MTDDEVQALRSILRDALRDCPDEDIAMHDGSRPLNDQDGPPVIVVWSETREAVTILGPKESAEVFRLLLVNGVAKTSESIVGVNAAAGKVFAENNRILVPRKDMAFILMLLE